MFNAPDIIMSIPDIKQIYDMNDKQIKRLNADLDTMDSNISLKTMNEETVIRWEHILNIIPKDDDQLDDRRFRIETKILEKLPYSERVLKRKLEALCPYGFDLEVSENRQAVSLKLTLKSKRMFEDTERMLEEMLPLNMTFKVSILYNMHENLKRYTHAELGRAMHHEIREEDLTDIIK